MRYLFGFLCVCALGIMPVVGCSETAGDGGSGGTTAREFPCNEQGIRDAIAEGGGPHTFDCVGSAIVTTLEEIVVDNDVILDGENGLTVDGDEEHRVFSIAEGVAAELRGFTVTGGTVIWPDAEGGGIYNAGELTLLDTTVQENTALPEANNCPNIEGCPAFGGGIFNSETGQLTLTNSTVSGNTSADVCFAMVQSAGGGILNEGTMMIENSSVSGNSACTGGGIRNHGTLTMADSIASENSPGGIQNHEVMTITNTTVRGNDGGGIANRRGATLTITNSTVSGNEGSGGINNSGTLMMVGSSVSGNTASGGGGLYNTGTMTLRDSTVSGNTAGVGGGIVAPGGEVTLANSTVSGNTADVIGGIQTFDAILVLTNATISGNTAPEGGSVNITETGSIAFTNTLVEGECQSLLPALLTSNGYNIESPGNTCGFDTNKGDQVNVSSEDLNLEALADNGGLTMTHALLTDPVVSAAINKIPAEVCLDAEGAPLMTDQRGLPRPVAILGPDAHVQTWARLRGAAVAQHAAPQRTSNSVDVHAQTLR